MDVENIETSEGVSSSIIVSIISPLGKDSISVVVTVEISDALTGGENKISKDIMDKHAKLNLFKSFVINHLRIE